MVARMMENKPKLLNLLGLGKIQSLDFLMYLHVAYNSKPNFLKTTSQNCCKQIFEIFKEKAFTRDSIVL